MIWIETVLHSSIFLKEMLEKLILKKSSGKKKHAKLHVPSRQRINPGAKF